MILLCLNVIVLCGINLKKQAVLFQTAHIMPHNISITYGKIPLFVTPLEKKDLQCINFYLQEMQGIGLNVFLM